MFEDAKQNPAQNSQKSAKMSLRFHYYSPQYSASAFERHLQGSPVGDIRICSLFPKQSKVSNRIFSRSNRASLPPES